MKSIIVFCAFTGGGGGQVLDDGDGLFCRQIEVGVGEATKGNDGKVTLVCHTCIDVVVDQVDIGILLLP